MDDEEFIKYPEDCTPEELEAQIQKIKKRFGSMKNATKFLESLKDKKTPAELLQALEQAKEDQKNRQLRKEANRTRIILAIIVAVFAYLMWK